LCRIGLLIKKLKLPRNLNYESEKYEAHITMICLPEKNIYPPQYIILIYKYIIMYSYYPPKIIYIAPNETELGASLLHGWDEAKKNCETDRALCYPAEGE